RDMMPLSVEEEIVCYVDKFFSKNPGRLSTPKDPEKIIQKLESYGADKPKIFKTLMNKFGPL
ncbi:MAG: phosphohydrolase, partial [Bacteroidota bacterium]